MLLSIMGYTVDIGDQNHPQNHTDLFVRNQLKTTNNA